MTATSLNETDETARAEAHIAEERAQRSGLRSASESGRSLASRLGELDKPVATTALIVVGVAAVVGIGVALARRSARNNPWRAPARSSFAGNVAKTAGLWALRLVARRAAQELVAQLSERSSPELVPTAPNQFQS
jgi:hypothetical protein